MKKNVNYLVYLLMLFFVIFVSPVNARDHDISYNQLIELNFVDQYEGLSCSPVNFYYLEYNDLKSVKYIVREFPTEKEVVETLKCTYLTDKVTGEENGEFYENYHLVPIPTYVEDITLDASHNPKWNIFLPIINDRYMIKDLKSVTSVKPSLNVSEKEKKYITVNCPKGTEDSCVFELNETYYKSEFGPVDIKYDIEYKDIFLMDHQASFTIHIIPNSYIYADFTSFLKCNFNSDWSSTDYNTTMKANLKIGNTISFPECSVDLSDSLGYANPLFKFYGWIDVSESYGQTDPRQMNTCANYKNVTTITLTEESKYFSACYTSNEGVALHLNGGELKEQEPSSDLNLTCDKVNNTCYFVNGGNFTLPGIKPESIPESYQIYGNAKFFGWSKGDGELLYKEGETVPADGSHYFAVYSDNKSTVNDAKSLSVYVDETEPINLTDIKSCVSNSSSVTTQVSGGQCFVTGNSVTTDYVDVTVKTGTEINIYKVKVLKREGNFNWTDDILLELGDNADYSITTEEEEKNFTASDGSSLCHEYIVSSSGVSLKNVATHNGFGLDFHQYRAVSRCETNLSHLALCIDPGRPGPKGIVYVVDDSFDSTSDYGKMLVHIVKEFVRKGVSKDDTSETAKNEIAGANAAARLAQYFYEEELASAADNKNSSHFKKVMAAYSAIGAELHTKCSGDLKKCDKNIIRDALTTVWTWANTDVLNSAVSYLASYVETESVAEINDVESEYKQTSAVYTENGLEFTYSGKLTNFGSDVNYNTLELKADCEHICTGSSCCNLKYSLVGNEFDYTFTFTLSESILKKFSTISSMQKPAIVLSSSEEGVKAANIFVLKPKSGNYQRMAIFNLEGANKRFPFDMKASCDFNYPSLNFNNPDTFNHVLFREMCCDTIKDNAAYKDIYSKYCDAPAKCYTSNFQMYCNPNKVGETDSIDSYSIKEAKMNNTDLLTCIVDVTANPAAAIKETKKKVDYSGNKYANSAFVNNSFCTVSCREEWDLSLPGFDNFLGTNAINAGGFFSIDRYIFFNTKRSCYSTFIDYEGYVSDQQELAKRAITAFQNYSEYTKVYDKLEDSKTTENVTYYTYTLDYVYWLHADNGTEPGDIDEDGCAEEATKPDPNCPAGKKCDPIKYCKTAKPCSHKRWKWKQHSHTCTLNVIKLADYYDFDVYVYDDGLESAGTDKNIAQGEADYDTWSTYKYELGGNAAYGVITAHSGSAVRSYYDAGDTPPSSTDSNADAEQGICCGTSPTDNCSYGEVTHSNLLDYVRYDGHNTYGYKNVKSFINENVNELQRLTKNIKDFAAEMSKCQNFYLINGSTTNGWNKVDTKLAAYDGKKLFGNSKIITDGSPSTEIRSDFSPEASYQYEERFFMAELGKEGKSNIIVPYKEENAKYLTEDKGCSGSIGRKNAYGEDLYVCKGETKEIAYNTQGPNVVWTPEENGAKYEGNGHKYVDQAINGTALVNFKIPLCKTPGTGVYNYQGISDNKFCETVDSVVYQYNYVMRSLQNSSFYVNKGHWYIDTVNDVKAHGDNAGAAVNNNAAGMKLKSTTLYGANYNTFPIGLNTPRNVYQYSYAFIGIGIYPNNKDTSRIMGNAEKSIIKDNVRKCFYEVFENFCRCCGDPIVWYTYDTSEIEDTDDYLDGINYPFDPSRDDYTNRTSDFGPKTSPVSLFDINGAMDRPLSSNWSSNDTYLYIGKEYKTDKGSELLKYITSKGDTIYSNMNKSIPEYSYILTPSILAEIRGNNVKYGYSSDTVDVLSKVCFKEGPCNMNDTREIPGFFHFGSKFLTGYLSSARNTKFDSIINGQHGVTSCIVKDASLGFKRECRFVDYQTADGHYLALK